LTRLAHTVLFEPRKEDMKNHLALTLTLVAFPAAAHPGHPHEGGLLASLGHFLAGLDPLLGAAAMLLAGCALALALRARGAR
jgi:hypothetical protein